MDPDFVLRSLRKGARIVAQGVTIPKLTIRMVDVKFPFLRLCGKFGKAV